MDSNQNIELERLRKLEKTFFTFLKMIPDFVYIKDKEHRFIYTSESFAKLTKHSSWKNLVGKTDFDVFPYEQAKDYFINEKDVIEKGKEIFNLKESYYNNKGELCFVLSNKTALFNEEGNITGLLGISRDISEQYFFQQKILEKNKELETIFKYAKDGIAILNLESKFLKSNMQYLAMTGFTKEELLQKTCLELTAPEDREKSIKALKEVIELGYVNNIEKTCLGKNGKRILVSISASLLPDKKAFLIVTRDMTSFKMLEEKSRLVSMGEMIGNIAHQWRQPLSFITTSASGLQLNSELGLLSQENIKQTSSSIIQQAEYLSQTIDNFKNFIKNDIVQENISLVSVIENTLTLVEAALKNNFIKLIKDFHCSLEIVGNKNELIEAFINIINNSKDVLQTLENDNDKFLFIDIKPAEKNSCEILIKDTGGGIDETIIHKVFEPYFTTKHQSQGTGLGLFLSDKIIRQRHGSMLKVYNEVFTYEGKEYKGACFSITFKGKKVEK